MTDSAQYLGVHPTCNDVS